MDKKQLRNQIKHQIASMNRLTYEQRCFSIASKLYAFPQWRESDLIAVTVSSQSEVDTWQIIRQGWLENKTVCVPKCDPVQKEMTFYRINSFSSLEAGFGGLYEPSARQCEVIEPEAISAVIVPGLVFDRQGYRIGFGGGYYDRFLARYTGQTISLALSFQITDRVPAEPHDIPVQTIVTEHGVITAR